MKKTLISTIEDFNCAKKKLCSEITKEIEKINLVNLLIWIVILWSCLTFWYYILK